MANVTKIHGKKGISYKFTAFCGYNKDGKQIRKFKTWTPAKNTTPKQAEKEARRLAQIFEDSVNKGLTAYDGTIKFEEYASQWIENTPLAPKTREGYKDLLKRINEAIGNIKLEKIQAHHLESFYKNLKEDGIKYNGLFAISNGLDKIMDDKGLTRDKLSKMADIAPSTVGAARRGERISKTTAEKIAYALNVSVNKIFDVVKNTTGLSDKTILHHHRLICAILGKAKKERIIPYNVALEHATAPKVAKKEAKYLDDVQAQKIVGLLLDEEDIRIKTCTLILLYSGIRRGELCGLEWQDVDFNKQLLHIRRASQWQKGNGIVEVPTKNESSVRAIRLPAFMFDVLSGYKSWWFSQRLANGSKWQGKTNRLFIQTDGKPINPDTINFWIGKFREKNNLPHFTPHSLRHTFATLQIMAGVNVKTIQARTGHAQASTLVDIYSHAIKTADELATEVLDDILTPKNIKANMS